MPNPTCPCGGDTFLARRKITRDRGQKAAPFVNVYQCRVCGAEVTEEGSVKVAYDVDGDGCVEMRNT